MSRPQAKKHVHGPVTETQHLLSELNTVDREAKDYHRNIRNMIQKEQEEQKRVVMAEVGEKLRRRETWNQAWEYCINNVEFLRNTQFGHEAARMALLTNPRPQERGFSSVMTGCVYVFVFDRPEDMADPSVYIKMGESTIATVNNPTTPEDMDTASLLELKQQTFPISLCFPSEDVFNDNTSVLPHPRFSLAALKRPKGALNMSVEQCHMLMQYCGATYNPCVTSHCYNPLKTSILIAVIRQKPTDLPWICVYERVHQPIDLFGNEAMIFASLYRCFVCNMDNLLLPPGNSPLICPAVVNEARGYCRPVEQGTRKVIDCTTVSLVRDDLLVQCMKCKVCFACPKHQSVLIAHRQNTKLLPLESEDEYREFKIYPCWQPREQGDKELLARCRRCHTDRNLPIVRFIAAPIGNMTAEVFRVTEIAASIQATGSVLFGDKKFEVDADSPPESNNHIRRLMYVWYCCMFPGGLTEKEAQQSAAYAEFCHAEAREQRKKSKAATARLERRHHLDAGSLSESTTDKKHLYSMIQQQFATEKLSDQVEMMLPPEDNEDKSAPTEKEIETLITGLNMTALAREKVNAEREALKKQQKEKRAAAKKSQPKDDDDSDYVPPSTRARSKTTPSTRGRGRGKKKKSLGEED